MDTIALVPSSLVDHRKHLRKDGSGRETGATDYQLTRPDEEKRKQLRDVSW